MNQDIINLFRNPTNPFETAGGIARRNQFEEARKKKPVKPDGRKKHFKKVKVGQKLIFRAESTVYTKTEPVKITTGPNKGKVSEISYTNKKGETRQAVCSDVERVVWVVD